MKKITAVVCSILMACTFAVGCGSSDDETSSSKAESSSAAETSSQAAESESSQQEESQTEQTESKQEADDTAASDDSSVKSNSEGGKLTQAYTESLSDGSFSLDRTIESEYTGEINMVLELVDTDMHLKMDAMGMDMYYVGGEMYMLDSTLKTYAKEAVTPEELGMTDMDESAYGLDDSYTFVSSEETEDGFICETFDMDTSELGLDSLLDSSDDTDTTYQSKYYFDKETEALKKIEVVSMGISETVTINSFNGDIEAIELPDFSGWTEQTYEEFLGADESLELDVTLEEELESAVQ